MTDLDLTKCLECDTPTLIVRVAGRCQAISPDRDRCPFAVKDKP